MTVECAAGVPGPCQEQLLIDISDRDPGDNPLGIPYSLVAEPCLPGTAARRLLRLLSTKLSPGAEQTA